MVVITICYREGINVDYYLHCHVPRSEALMKPLGLERAETRVVQLGLDGSQPPYVILTSLYFPTLEVFQNCMADPTLEELLADAVNYYNGKPEIYIGEVVVNARYTS